MKSRIEEQNGRVINRNVASSRVKKDVELNKDNLENESKVKKEEVLKNMLKNVDDEMKREEIIHMLLEQKVSKVIKEEESEKKQFSYKVLNFVGSGKFIAFMGIFLLAWTLIDVVFLLADKFNPYSFVIMNVILSFVVLIFCSLIVFNQNKKKKMDRRKSENDYKVNLKNEIIIEDLHYKLDDLIEKQDKIAKRVLELEKKKKAVAAKGNKEYKFIVEYIIDNKFLESDVKIMLIKNIKEAPPLLDTFFESIASIFSKKHLKFFDSEEEKMGFIAILEQLTQADDAIHKKEIQFIKRLKDL